MSAAASERLAFLRAMLGKPPAGGGVLFGAVRSPSPRGVGPGSWDEQKFDSVESLAAFLEDAADRAELYASVAWFDPEEGRRKHGAMHRSWIGADIDSKDMPGAGEQARRQNALHLARSVPDGVVVETGHGYHVHVRLPQGKRLQDYESREDGLRAVHILARALRLFIESAGRTLWGVGIEVDRCHGAERAWRVPHSLNMKTNERGRDRTSDRSCWRRVQLDGGGPDVAPVFDLRHLVPFTDAAEAEEDETSARQVLRLPQGDGLETFEPSMLSPKMRESWPFLGHRDDPSKADWRLVCLLAEAGHSNTLAEDAVRKRRGCLPSPTDRMKGQRADYVRGTVVKAFRHALGRAAVPGPDRRPYIPVPVDGYNTVRERDPDFRLYMHLLRAADLEEMRGRERVVLVTFAALAAACAHRSGAGRAWVRWDRQAIRGALERLDRAGLISLPPGNVREAQGRKLGGFRVEVPRLTDTPGE